MHTIPDQFVQLAETLAAQARETAQRTSNEPEVEIKADGTPVTTLDRAVEAALRRVIAQQQPGHGIIGEEFGTLAAQARETAQRTSNEPEVEIKADGTPVTTVDRAVEAALRRVIAQQQPGHGIIGEEFGAEGAEREWVWVLDPVDGTRQFAAGLPNFGTLIALCHEGRPVIGVIAHFFYESTCIGVAGRGMIFNGRPVRCAGPDRLTEVVACISDPDCFDARTTPGMQAIRARTRWNVFDGGCLGYASLARGLLGLCLNGPNLEPFDIAALVPVVEAAGGRITDWQGNPLTIASEGEIIGTSSPRLHESALDALSGARR